MQKSYLQVHQRMFLSSCSTIFSYFKDHTRIIESSIPSHVPKKETDSWSNYDRYSVVDFFSRYFNERVYSERQREYESRQVTFYKKRSQMRYRILRYAINVKNFIQLPDIDMKA